MKRRNFFKRLALAVPMAALSTELLFSSVEETEKESLWHVPTNLSYFNEDGTSYYVNKPDLGEIHKYDLTIPFCPSTAVYKGIVS